MARPTKRTPELVKVITDAVERGASDKAAYLAAEIAESTFYEWLKDEEFSEAVTQARARAVKKAEHLVFEGNPLTWLQRGPGRRLLGEDEGWRDASRVELTGADGGPLRVGPAVDLSNLSLAEKRELLALTKKAEQGGEA